MPEKSAMLEAAKADSCKHEERAVLRKGIMHWLLQDGLRGAAASRLI